MNNLPAASGTCSLIHTIAVTIHNVFPLNGGVVNTNKTLLSLKKEREKSRNPEPYNYYN